MERRESAPLPCTLIPFPFEGRAGTRQQSGLELALFHLLMLSTSLQPFSSFRPTSNPQLYLVTVF